MKVTRVNLKETKRQLLEGMGLTQWVGSRDLRANLGNEIVDMSSFLGPLISCGGETNQSAAIATVSIRSTCSGSIVFMKRADGDECSIRRIRRGENGAGETADRRYLV